MNFDLTMIDNRLLVMLWVILLLFRVYFFLRVKQIDGKNRRLIDNKRSLLKPNAIRAAVKAHGVSVPIYFKRIKQSESASYSNPIAMEFPIDGVNEITFNHEFGHVLSMLENSYRWVRFSDKYKILHRMAVAIGSERRIEAAAWRRVGLYNLDSAQAALKAHKYLQLFGIFSIISTILLVIIIVGILF